MEVWRYGGELKACRREGKAVESSRSCVVSMVTVKYWRERPPEVRCRCSTVEGALELWGRDASV